MKSHKINVIVGIAAGLVIASIAIIFAFSASVTKADGFELSPVQVKVAELKALVDSLVEEPTFGASSAPSLIDGCLDFGGGALYCQYSQRMTNASTTCAFRSPTASSTLVSATAQVRSAFGGTFSIEFGKSDTVMATTTSLGGHSGIAGAITITASSTPAEGGDAMTQNFNSGQFLNIKVGSSSPTMSGNCTAVFRTI